MEERYKYIIDNSKDFITLINREYVYELVNETYCDGINKCKDDIILEIELDRAQHSEGHDLLILLFIQIKHIETVIEMYGREIADILLENTGVRLQSEMRASDYVFHFDGRQFAVLLSHVDNKLDAGNMAKQIFDTVTFPYNFRGHDIIVGCQIGAAVYPHDSEDKEELIKKTLSAMMESDRLNTWFTLYDENLYEQALRRIELNSAAHRALEDKHFTIKYQPIVDRNFKIVGAEALLRWEHPTLGHISPMEFIPLAEQSDLIFAIGKWIMFSVCEQLSLWSRKYGIYISLNLSSREFASPDLITNVKSALRKSPSFPPRFLKIEITENESIRNIDESISRINTLRQIGVEVFIDDFGTGNSSLQYLKKLPAEVLKIDREFVKDIEYNDEDREFLDHIVHMAYVRGKKVLIEGVENRQQADLLVRMGCNRMQGFYFSKALPPREFETLLQNNLPLPAALQYLSS